MQVFGKTQDNLWTLIAAPTIWGFHFLSSYFLVAYRCAPNAEPFKQIGEHAGGDGRGDPRLPRPDHADPAARMARVAQPGRRHPQQRGHARGPRALSGAFHAASGALSFAAVVFETMPVLLIGDCR